MRIEPEIAGVSLVMLGNFNPSIFAPAWFGRHRLLSDRMVDNANTEIVHPQIAKFNADWLNAQVVPERFQIQTTNAPYYVCLLDLAIRIFREFLPHTPLKSMGINREVHFSVRSFKERDRLGRRLAPVEPWGDWGKKLELDGEHGGMTSLTMTQVNPEGRPPGGQINVKVEPSTRIGQGRRGVYVQVNDHYAIEESSSQMASNEIVTLLEKKFDESLRRADEIIDHVMSLPGK